MKTPWEFLINLNIYIYFWNSALYIDIVSKVFMFSPYIIPIKKKKFSPYINPSVIFIIQMLLVMWFELRVINYCKYYWSKFHIFFILYRLILYRNI